jgi:hypothetical protein
MNSTVRTEQELRGREAIDRYEKAVMKALQIVWDEKFASGLAKKPLIADNSSQFLKSSSGTAPESRNDSF